MADVGAHQKLHIDISLAGLTAHQQRHVLKAITGPQHPSQLYSFLKHGAGHWVNQGRDNASFQALLPDWEPGQPAEMQAAHLTAAALVEQLVREGLTVTLPGGEQRCLAVRYRELSSTPGQVVVRVRGLTPEYAQAGLTSMLLDCAGYTQQQVQVAREFMAPFPWSMPEAPVGNSSIVVAYVRYPDGDPCLKQLPSAFSVGTTCEGTIEVDTRGVNMVVPPPPPRRQEQPQLPLAPAQRVGPGEGSRGQPTGPARGLQSPPGLQDPRGPPPSSHAQGSGQGAPPRGQPALVPAVTAPAAAAAAATTAPVPLPQPVIGPEEAMGPAEGQGQPTQPGGSGVGQAGARGWQGPTCSRPWQHTYGQQLQQAQPQPQPRQQLQQPATTTGQGRSLLLSDHPAVHATATGLPPVVEADLGVQYAAWQRTTVGGSWDATLRDWLREEGVEGVALEGALLLFYEEHRPRLASDTQGPGRASDMPAWVIEWARRMGLVATYNDGASSAANSSSSSSRAPSEAGAEAGAGGGTGGDGGRSSSRVRRPALRACDLPSTFGASRPRPMRGRGGGRP